MKKIFLYILFVLFSYPLLAQDEEFPLGSPYSSFGIGELQLTTSTKTDAMNIIGISVYGNYVNAFNPAANTGLQYTNISAAFKYSFLKTADNTKSVTSSYGNVYGINIGIPLNQKLGWTLFAGFNPYSFINYKVKSSGAINGNSYTQFFAGSGGISRINLGMTYKLLDKISIGADYNFSFGNINKFSYVKFDNSSLSNAQERKEMNMTGYFLKGGLVFDIGKIFNAKQIENLTLGFVYQSGLKLNSSVDMVYTTSIGNDTASYQSFDINVPQGFGFGISNKFGKQFLASAEIFLQQWDDYMEKGKSVNYMKNNFRAGLGFAVLPMNKMSLSFWESLEYRFGFFYDKSNFLINNEQINRYGVSIGFGIPLNQYNSVDIGFSYSTRGKTDIGFFKDDYFKITAGFNFGELWFLESTREK